MFPQNVTIQPSCSKDEIHSQVERIIRDSAFFSSDILKRFLLFIVSETLEGRSHCLKEYTIAVNVLKKSTSFNPQENGIVRIHAGRLRRALSKYYSKMGQTEPIRISIPKGSYVPVFEHGSGVSINGANNENSKRSMAWPLREKNKITIAVLPFRHCTEGKVADLLADGIAFQLTSGLQHVDNVSVTAFQMIKNLAEKTVDFQELISAIGSQLILTGGIETLNDRVRVSMELIRPGTFEQLWSEHFDKKMPQSDLFEVQDEITDAAMLGLQDYLKCEFGPIPKGTVMKLESVKGVACSS